MIEYGMLMGHNIPDDHNFEKCPACMNDALSTTVLCKFLNQNLKIRHLFPALDLEAQAQTGPAKQRKNVCQAPLFILKRNATARHKTDLCCPQIKI